MPGLDGQIVLYCDMPTGGRLGVGLLDGNLTHAHDQLVACIEASSEDRNDPNQGTWYCERINR